MRFRQFRDGRGGRQPVPSLWGAVPNVDNFSRIIPVLQFFINVHAWRPWRPHQKPYDS